jgi:aminoglycoside 3-N-acetyltransferase
LNGERWPSIAGTGPATAKSMADDLRRLGVGAGDVVLMHSSYKSLGDLAGGPQAVVQGLLDALGPHGTLVVPTHTPDNTDPAGWQHPPVPAEWWPIIRAGAPGFDTGRTPASRWMGRLSELVRTWPGALRSDHPQVSFAAVGARAKDITEGHRLDDGLGEQSPLGAVNRLDGKVLLLGCNHDNNTSLHLAEWRQPHPPRQETSSAIRRPDGTSEWVTWTDVAEDESDFGQLGADFDATGAIRIGRVAAATAKLMRQRAVVDFAVGWIARNRAPKS